MESRRQKAVGVRASNIPNDDLFYLPSRRQCMSITKINSGCVLPLLIMLCALEKLLSRSSRWICDYGLRKKDVWANRSRLWRARSMRHLALVELLSGGNALRIVVRKLSLLF